MENFALGFKALFRIWGDPAFAARVKPLLSGEPAPAPVPAAPPPGPAKPARSEALTLLAALQREARLVDFIKEPIAGYTDEQVGAAVRGVHRDCAAVLDRLFAIESLRPENEGAQIEVPAAFDPAEFRLVGKVPERGPFRGALCHSGWKATKCELPQWSGRGESALVVAPAEVELK